MGIDSTGANLTGQVVAGTATGAATSPTFWGRRLNVAFTGTPTFAATVERTYDGGTTWIPLSVLGTPVAFTVPATESVDGLEEGLGHRINVASVAAGTLTYRMSC
jgi:hypothetical protein